MMSKTALVRLSSLTIAASGPLSDKFSAVEIIVVHIYFLPLPLTPSNTLSELTTMATTVASGTSTPTTTPVKKARLTAIDLD